MVILCGVDRNDNEYNTEKVVDANDSMVDRVNIHIDTLSGVNAPSDAFLESVRRSGAWNATPVIAKIQVETLYYTYYRYSRDEVATQSV